MDMKRLAFNIEYEDFLKYSLYRIFVDRLDGNIIIIFLRRQLNDEKCISLTFV
jgi:hypothetical protein